MKPILVIVPSLRRAHKAQDFIDHWRESSSGLSDLVFVLEDNDETAVDYPNSPDMGYLDGHYRSPGAAFNAAFETWPGYGFYAPLNDDHWIRTAGWEDRIIADEADAIAYADDGFQGERLATAPVIAGIIVRALGWIAPPGIDHLYIDNAWMDIGSGIGALHYRPDILFEHRHPVAGKGDWDAIYAEANNGAAYERGVRQYQRWLAESSADDIARVRKALGR